MPFLPPASITMLQSVIRSSIESDITPSPANSMARYVAPSTPMSPMMCRIRSLAIRYGGGGASDSKSQVVRPLPPSLPAPHHHGGARLAAPPPQLANGPGGGGGAGRPTG